MNEHLKSVISKLYRPPATGRQVFALSRPDAQRVPALPSVAMISITAAERTPAQLEGFEHLLRLSFADVDFKSQELSARAREKLPEAFQPSQAREIVEFIEALPAEIQSVVVHCEGGFSRSCAVAQFLHDRLGYVGEPERLTEANRSVYETLIATGYSSV
ncbi:MAG: hypothetical protein ABIT83_02605 [Massilia sp.]